MDQVIINKICKNPSLEGESDYGQFCDLDDYANGVVTQKLPDLYRMEMIPENYDTFESYDEYIEPNARHSHGLIASIENILRAKQYIYEICLSTPEKQQHTVYNMIVSSLVCGVVYVKYYL
jgi:hypothetical protein